MPRDPEAWVSQIRKGLVEFAVLMLLAQRERYGTEIVEDLGAHPGLAISAGTIYPLLSRLKKAELIESSWAESPVGPPRKYYRLTDAGSAELLVMSRSWSEVIDAVDKLLEGGVPDVRT